MATRKKIILHHLLETFFYVAIFILLSIEIILNLTPPIARDALIHHLAIPKLWLKNGFYEIKWADFSYFPMNVDLLYMIPLYFKKDFLANFIHMGFGIGTALLIYRYLNNKISRIAGLLGVVIFLSTPAVFRSSTQAYVDLGLTFFITACVLALIRYRDSHFEEFKWLFISSLAMGLALGTKYNALIPWFFLSLAVVFLYSRDTGKQWKALEQGLLFFMISLFFFSPWLIKNGILTGNPLYPMFKGGLHFIDSGEAHTGFFKMREILYGENLWETLLIPVRIFFQGQDNSARYFDGVLNPILIIAPPFALMDKSFYRDKLFFIAFAIFFILTVFFLEQKVFSMEAIVRYILPVVPVLSILTVLALFHIWNRVMNLSNPSREIWATLLCIFFIALMSRNIFYIKDYYHNINPMNYISGRESRDEFIARHNSSYPAIQYINTFTPANARIRLIFLAGRGYYLDRMYDEGISYGMGDVSGLVAGSRDGGSFQSYLRSLGCTHMLVRMDSFLNYLHDNYSRETANQLLKQLNRTTELIYEAKGYAVFRLLPST